MQEINHIIKRRIWFFGWYKWAALVLLIILFFCFFMKRCSDSDPVQKVPKTNEVNHNTQNRQDLGNSSGLNDNSAIPLNNYVKRPITPDRIETDSNDPLTRKFVNDIVNVYLKDSVDLMQFAQYFQRELATYDLFAVNTAESYKRVQFQVRKDKRDEVISLLRKDSAQVKYATKEWIYESPTIQNTGIDPDFNNVRNSWFYNLIGVFEAWKITKGNDQIKIAVLDDGFDLNHKELKNKFTQPWNIIDYSSNITFDSELQFHGTHVAGTIVAEANNGFGISGVAPDCVLMPIQISDDSGYITMSSVLDGIFYALKNKARIINLSIAVSLGSNAILLDAETQEMIKNNLLKDEEKLWDEVFDLAKKSNTVIVQAAGNDGVLSGIDPMKRNQNSLVVGAIDHNHSKTDFSNFGENVDVFVPGKEIYSSLPNNEMGYMDGTSMASPIVAGSVALVMAYKPELNAEEIISLIRRSVKDERTRILDLTKIFRS